MADGISVGAALAEHIGQSKIARVQQQLVNLELLDAQKSAREKEIKAWLAPAAYDVEYYQNDLANARALRHPKTCEWIFEKEEMEHFFTDTPNTSRTWAQEESLLWVYAKPVCTMQNRCPPQGSQNFELWTKRLSICLGTLHSTTQLNANSKIYTGCREDYPLFTLN